jgi:hypothetical protein
MIEQALGHAMVDAAFQERLFSDPEGVGREIGLDEKDIELLKSMDKESFVMFREKLDTQMMKEPGVILFCQTY